jgi:hypothetical protein
VVLPPRRPQAPKDSTRLRETAAQRRFRDRDEFGPLGAFPRLERGGIGRVSHQLSWRGQRGAVPSGVFDPRGAESYFTVRRAPRGEKTPLGAVHRWPQQKAGEKCGLRPSGHPDEWRKENAARGPESARSNIGRGVRPCSHAARRRAAGVQRARSATPTRACSRRRRRPRPRGRGRRPRTAGTETGTDVDAFISRRTPRSP